MAVNEAAVSWASFANFVSAANASSPESKTTTRVSKPASPATLVLHGRQAALRWSCRPSLISSMIFALKASTGNVRAGRERESVLDKTIGTLLSNGGILHITPRPRRMANLEEVFRLSGVPTYTFVQPDRYDVFKLETNSEEKIEEMIALGEAALNVKLPDTQRIARHAQGSFQIAQLLCHKLCVLDHITETAPVQKWITTSLNVAIEDVMSDLARQFKEAAVTFARGSKLRREGRAPCLHILRWLSETEEWSIDLSEAVNAYPDMKGSVGQVIDKGYLEALLADPEKHDILSPYFHFEPSTRVLSVEDPKLVFYLKNVIWRVFTRQVGYRADYFKGRYDFALSFAGPNRDLAKTLHEFLAEREVASFYDENEQHRIIAQNIEDYLAPIYRSEARYVVVLQSPDYPKRIWTKFESDNFRERFGTQSVIPIRYTNVVPGFFTEDAKYGGIPFDSSKDLEEQAQEIAAILCKRIIEDRQSAREAEAVESIELAPQEVILPGLSN
jgi:hypothetical protein